MKLKPYQEDRGEEGIYDRRNKLNNLSGKQWLFSTRSVKTQVYPHFYNKNKLVLDNYYDFLPVFFIKDLIRTFTKPKSIIIDPICNFGSSGYATYFASEERKYMGWNKKPHNGYILNIENKKHFLSNDTQIIFYKNDLMDLNKKYPVPNFIFTELIYRTDISNKRQ
ncbi:MAG: hypothetical protein ACXAC7_03020, partial [Candidatus Hodarchaeales archaeon]